MLTQEDFVAPNMSGERNLQRSSWKAEAIRRGDLKISGPIPITEETPLSEEEERKYAEEHKVEEEPQSTDESSLPGQTTQLPPPPPPTASQNASVQPPVDQVEPQPQLPDEKHEPEQQKSSAGVQETREMPRRTSPDPVSYSSPSPFPSIPESSTKTTPKKKRKSGLRNVFRKMFGRKSRDEPHEEVPVPRHGHHRSEPITLHESPKMTRENVAGRISDMPVRELEPINPLGQHLPFPMNVNASPPHEYLTFDVPANPIRRRATLPSVHLSDAEAQALSAAVGGSNKHMASTEERHNLESIPSPQIGIALSSPPHSAQSVQSKRRSRSAGALRDLAKTRPSIERRRSAEIRYWRNSYQSGSIYSTATPRPRTAQTVETVRSADTQDTSTKAPWSIAESSTIEMPTVAQHDQDISEIPLPVDAFNFGNLKTGFSDEEPDDGGPEVPARSEERLSIEERVSHLEDNMRTLETSVRRISGRSNRQTIILENAPKGRRSRNRSSSATSDPQGSRHSSSGSRRAVSVTRDEPGPPSPAITPLSAVDEFPSSGDRRQTVVALEPSAMPRPSTEQQATLVEQFSKVFEALKYERVARKALERQVYDLQREVTDLHAMVNKVISRSPSYPTPSPDAVVTSNEERMSTPRAVHRPERGLGFEMEGSGSRLTRETIISKFSHSDSEAEDYSVTSSREDVTSPETWATPKEESGFGSGFFSARKQSQGDLEEMF